MPRDTGGRSSNMNGIKLADLEGMGGHERSAIIEGDINKTNPEL